jgi:hypothetical protein
MGDDAFSRALVQARPFFLEDSLRRGRSPAEVAGFLSRRTEDVREKAKELGLNEVQSSIPVGQRHVPPRRMQSTIKVTKNQRTRA